MNPVHAALAALTIAGLLAGQEPAVQTTPAGPEPADIVLVTVNERPLTLADALGSFQSSHTGHGVLVRGDGPLRELVGRLVERELFMAEADALEIPAEEIITRSVADYWRTLAADEFWKREVTDKISVGEADVEAFYAKTDVALKLTLIQTRERAECEALRARVEAGEDMAGLASRESVHTSRSLGGQLTYVRRGDLDAAIEDVAFAIEQPGTLAPIFAAAGGFCLVRLDERSVNPDRLPREVALPQIRKILRDRAEDELGGALEQRLEQSGGWVIDESLFEPALLVGGEQGAAVAARAAGETLTLAQVREALDLDALRAADPETVRGAGRQVAREWARRASIWKLASAGGFTSDPLLAAKVEIFRRDMILRVLCERFVWPKQGPTEDELRAYYEQNKAAGFTRPPERRLAYIAVATKPEADKLLERIGAGEDFEKLAKEASLDRRSAVHGGRIGWIKQGEILPEIEGRAFALANGAIDGPIETPQGWFLVRVLDRREPQLIPFENARVAAEKRLVKERQQESYTKWVTALRERAAVQLDEAGLAAAVAWLDRQPKKEPKPIDPSSPHSQAPAPGAQGEKKP